MEKIEELKSILPYLPLEVRSSSLSWPPQIADLLETISKGPDYSKVNSGEALSVQIARLRICLPGTTPFLSRYGLPGYALFFDQKMSKSESGRWFAVVIPTLASLLLRFPSLLETHYQNADNVLDGIVTGLRVLDPQNAGIVSLNQELIAALLACSFFCLFPEADRHEKHLQHINFDELFGSQTAGYNQKMEQKIRCLVHYFERISSHMPQGIVSFERKVLPWENQRSPVVYPNADFWKKSTLPLCPIKVHTSGLIEDLADEALEVDFADEYFGGLALTWGCLQEEIRFMINPELIAGMVFLPRMDANEAIEVVGVERFTRYTGYASSFRYAGDYVDEKDVDIYGRRKTRVIAIDALPKPGLKQYELDSVLREINKALCGFWRPSNNGQQANAASDRRFDHGDSEFGVATGNWGCGVFRGDPELKSMIQWLATSQAERPFMSYYTFGLQAVQNLHQVADWIVSCKWTVGDLWTKVVEYSSERSNGETELGFFTWLIPSSSA